MYKTLLVTGISGFLGWHIATHPQSRWRIVGLYHKHKPEHDGIETVRIDIDEDFSSLKRLISDIRPDAILHLAAHSDPNSCERDLVSSYRTNVESTNSLARYAKEQGIYFLFVSTDMVFDGKDAPYDEQDAVDPINVYGKQKVEAERYLLSLGSNVAIARLPLMYGITKTSDSFFSKWLERLRHGHHVHAFTDEYRTVVSGRSISEGLFLLLDKAVEGVWHLGGKERVSRYEFAMTMAEAFHLPSENIIPSKQDEIVHSDNKVAKRAPDVSLDSSKAYALGYDPMDIRSSMSELYDLYVDQTYHD